MSLYFSVISQQNVIIVKDLKKNYGIFRNDENTCLIYQMKFVRSRNRYC